MLLYIIFIVLMKNQNMLPLNYVISSVDGKKSCPESPNPANILGGFRVNMTGTCLLAGRIRNNSILCSFIAVPVLTVHTKIKALSSHALCH